MSAHVLLNLLNELGHEFNKFNTTRALLIDSIYHMTLRLHLNLISVVKTLFFCHYVHYRPRICPANSGFMCVSNALYVR